MQTYINIAEPGFLSRTFYGRHFGSHHHFYANVFTGTSPAHLLWFSLSEQRPKGYSKQHPVSALKDLAASRDGWVNLGPHTS